MRFLLATFIVALLNGGLAQADELRIIGHGGLTRAVKRNVSSADVELNFRKGIAGLRQVRLINNDGLLPPQAPDRIDEETVHFKSVPSGSWKITFQEHEPAPVDLKRVSIE